MTTDRLRQAAGLLLGTALIFAFAACGQAGDEPDGKAKADAPVAKAAPAKEPPRHAVPAGRPIQLDGRPLAAEWSPALTLPLGDGHSKLRLMQYRGSLMIAFESTLPWPRRTNLQLYFAPEDAKQGTRSPGAVQISFEPFAHDRAHVFAFHSGPGGAAQIFDRIVVRGSYTENGCALEMGLQLDVLGITAANRPPLRFCALWAHPNAKGGTWPAGLEFGGQPGSPPPAMASVGKWGTLDGWGDPSAPGAFSKTDWTRWVEQDRQVTKLASEAYGAYRLLVEEWKETRKEDTVIEAEILDNLRALGKLEPLTAQDLLAIAKALRFLNRHERALGMLDALLHHADRAAAQNALWERAQTLEATERFEAAAADWQTLADRVGSPYGARYAQSAKRALELQAKWQAEQDARAACAAAGDLPRVELHTNRGVILLELFAKDVPKAVEHFLGLVESKFYDGTCFHRVMGEFMAQGGDPKSRELGCEFAGSGTSAREIELEINPRHTFWRGAVAFANKAHDPRNGSQFFLLTAPKPDLGKFTCFGYVLRGQDVVDRLSYGDKLEKAVIVRKGK